MRINDSCHLYETISITDHVVHKYTKQRGLTAVGWSPVSGSAIANGLICDICKLNAQDYRCIR